MLWTIGAIAETGIARATRYVYNTHMTKMLRSRLDTVSDVVAAYGGPTKLALWAGHGPSMVTNWLARGYIPGGWHYRMSKWAAAHDYEISPRVFGEDDDVSNDNAHSSEHSAVG